MPVLLREDNHLSTPSSMPGKPPKYLPSGSKASGSMPQSSSLLTTHSRPNISSAHLRLYGSSYYENRSLRDSSESRDSSYGSSSSYSLTRAFSVDKSSPKDTITNGTYRKNSSLPGTCDLDEFVKIYSPDNYIPGTLRNLENRLSSSIKSSPQEDFEVRSSKAILQSRYSTPPSSKTSFHENSSSPINFNRSSSIDTLNPKVKSMHLTDENHNMVGYSIGDEDNKYYTDQASSFINFKRADFDDEDSDEESHSCHASYLHNSSQNPCTFTNSSSHEDIINSVWNSLDLSFIDDDGKSTDVSSDDKRLSFSRNKIDPVLSVVPLSSSLPPALTSNVSRNKKCYNCPSPCREPVAVVKGLRNVGNTCYMNSVLQCLNRTPPLISYILKYEYSSDLKNVKCAALFKAFAELIEKMNDSVSRSPISALSFKNELQQYARQFVGRNQHDAQEFLRYLLQGLHEALNQGEKKVSPCANLDNLSETEKGEESWRQYNILERSKIIDLFVGQLKSSLKCTVCNKCSNTYEIFWDVSLPLPEQSSRTTLRECLTEFTKEEILDGKNMPVCASCKKPRKCTKRFHFQRLPKILVLHLKRFTNYSSRSSSYISSGWTRSSVSVDFPVVLDMTDFASSRELSSIKYSLYGFSCHSGTLDAGHYVAYCKNIRTDEWFEFNDSEVIPVSVSEVQRKQPYLLFYHQIGTSSEVYHV